MLLLSYEDYVWFSCIFLIYRMDKSKESSEADADLDNDLNNGVQAQGALALANVYAKG